MIKYLLIAIILLVSSCECPQCQVKSGTVWVDVGKPITDATTYKVVKVEGRNVFSIDGTGVTHRADIRDFTTYCIEKDSVAKY